jgi:prepilin-type N-terminal cleavage/methylation domain-containing protein
MRPRHDAPRADNAAGFTLIETLVAFVVLSIVLSTVYGIMGGGLRQAKRDEDRLLLAAVAENLLVRARLDLFPARGPISGEIAGGVRWTITSTPYVLPVPPTPDEPDRREPFGGSDGDGGSFGRGGDEDSSSFGRDSAGGSSFGNDDDEAFGRQGRDMSAERDTGERPAFGDEDLSREEDSGGQEARDSGDGGVGDEARERERQPLRLRVLTVVVVRGEERFALESLAPVPQERERGLRPQP